MPDFTPKKVDAADKAEAPKKEEFDRMQAARDQMKRARESMGMGSRFGYKKGGIKSNVTCVMVALFVVKLKVNYIRRLLWLYIWVKRKWFTVVKLKKWQKVA
jgi:hypothetical protein